MTDHSELFVETSDSNPGMRSHNSGCWSNPGIRSHASGWSKKFRRSDSKISQASRAAQQRVGLTAQKNLQAMFAGSDDPQELKEALGKVAKVDPKLTFAMLRFGWEKTLSIRRERAVNIGMIGALIFSVTLSMAVAPLAPSERVTAEDFEDFWSDARPLFEDIYNILITLGATLSAVSVVNSALYILWIQIYVSDADDFIWFCREYHVTLWVDAPMVFALFFSVLSVAFASVTLYPNPVASVCFLSVIGVLSFTSIVFVMGVVPGERRMKENFSAMSESYNAYIEEAADQVSKTVSSGNLSRKDESMDHDCEDEPHTSPTRTPMSPITLLTSKTVSSEKLSRKDKSMDQILCSGTTGDIMVI